MDPDEIVAAFRLLGTVYRKAVMELDASTLRSFFLIRAEQLINLQDVQLLEVLVAEVTQQVHEAQHLLNDLRTIAKPGRKAAPLRVYRSHVPPTPSPEPPLNVVELDS